MTNLIDIFAPYLAFISFFITLIVNAYLIIKGTSWYNIIIANVLLSITMNMLGLGSYDFLTQAFSTIVDLLIGLFEALFEGIGNLFKTIIDALNPFS